MIIPLAIGSAAVLCTFLYASCRDLKERRVPFRTWYPMLAVTLPMAAWFYASFLIMGEWTIPAYFLALTAIFAVVFYLFAWLNLFGGADAWALIFLSVSIPAFPIEPLSGYPPAGFFPFAVLVNALLLNLLTPLLLGLQNLLRGQRAPFPYMLLGYPVPAVELPGAYGFIMEDIEENEDGSITRRFVRPLEAVRRMFSGEKRIYTKDLRLHPENYSKEIALFKLAGQVWISYGIPFIVPLTAGFLSALFFGDILFFLIKSVSGV
ncbi:MAG TPA: A24 family peptidase C-terminal domain-containing protein [Methanolinea sp.]|nr:A24 family peptidase C-terminal domain-containing protein [Methanolinea sp.]